MAISLARATYGQPIGQSISPVAISAAPFVKPGYDFRSDVAALIAFDLCTGSLVRGGDITYPEASDLLLRFANELCAKVFVAPDEQLYMDLVFATAGDLIVALVAYSQSLEDPSPETSSLCFDFIRQIAAHG